MTYIPTEDEFKKELRLEDFEQLSNE